MMPVLELQPKMNESDTSPYEVNGNLTTDSQVCDGIHCYSDAVFETATALTILLAVVGATGNILTVFAILSSRLRNNINSILICQLSLADAIYCSFVLPLQAMVFYQRTWMLGNILCELLAALRIWLIGTNMLVLSFIALYRFFHVVNPQNHTRYSQRPWFVFACIICWALPFIFCFTPLVGWWGTYAFQERILQCTFSTASSKSHKIASITAGYLIPCFFICVCYARIGCVVFSSRKKTSRGSQYRRQKARRESLRLTGMMALIFFGFLLGTTPYFTLNTLDSKLQYPMPHIWVPFLAWLMYSMNPIIYTVMDVNFQRAYRRLLLCMVFKTDNIAETSQIQDRQTSLLMGKNEKVQNP